MKIKSAGLQGHYLRPVPNKHWLQCTNCSMYVTEEEVVSNSKFVPMCPAPYADSECAYCEGYGRWVDVNMSRHTCEYCLGTGIFMRRWDLHFINWPRQYVILKDMEDAKLHIKKRSA